MVLPFQMGAFMPEIRHVHDVIVIGGGLAGSALAVLLARAGKDILLLEKETAPHHKVCGEFLRKEAADDLRLFDIELENLGAQKIHSLRLINGEESITGKLPSSGWSLSRFVLDEALLQKAKEAGATVRRGQSVKDFSRKDNIWQVEISKQPLQHSRNIFLATGKHDLHHWKREIRRPEKADFIGFKMYYSLSPDQLEALTGHTEIILLGGGGYAGLQRVENNHANLCFLIGKADFINCEKNLDILLEDPKRQSPHLARRLDGAQALWTRPQSIYPIPYGYIDTSAAQPGLFRLGDQKAVIQSFAGNGMAMAIRGAMTAAEIYMAGGGSAQYNASLQRAFQRPLGNAQILAQLASKPYFKKAIFRAVQKFPSLLEKVYHYTGVSP